MMAFTYDVSTSRGQVRLLIADTNEGTGIWSDAEVDYALSLGGSVNAAVVVLARQRIAQLTRLPDESLPDGTSVSRAGQLASMQALIQQYGGAGGVLPTATVSFGGYVGSDASQPIDELIPSGLPS